MYSSKVLTPFQKSSAGHCCSDIVLNFLSSLFPTGSSQNPESINSSWVHGPLQWMQMFCGVWSSNSTRPAHSIWKWIHCSWLKIRSSWLNGLCLLRYFRVGLHWVQHSSFYVYSNLLLYLNTTGKGRYSQQRTAYWWEYHIPCLNCPHTFNAWAVPDSFHWPNSTWTYGDQS